MSSRLASTRLDGGGYTAITPDLTGYRGNGRGYLPRKPTEAVLIPYPRLPGFSFASAG